MPTTIDRRRKVRDIYTFISEHLYFGRPDLEVEGEQVNATLLLSLLTALVGGVVGSRSWHAEP